MNFVADYTEIGARAIVQKSCCGLIKQLGRQWPAEAVAADGSCQFQAAATLLGEDHLMVRARAVEPARNNRVMTLGLP